MTKLNENLGIFNQIVKANLTSIIGHLEVETEKAFYKQVGSALLDQTELKQAAVNIVNTSLAKVLHERLR